MNKKAALVRSLLSKKEIENFKNSDLSKDKFIKLCVQKSGKFSKYLDKKELSDVYDELRKNGKKEKQEAE